MVADQGTSALLSAAELAATRLESLADMGGGVYLTESDDAIRRLDQLEVEAWGGFVRRLQQIAGEV